MKKMFKDFFKNLKEYVNYLMKIDFKELFINVVILFCILALSSFVYVPISVVQDLIINFFTIFIEFNSTLMLVYNWIFSLISAILSVLAFIYLFNKRFDDVEELKKQINEKPVKKEEKKEEIEVLELPKTKKNK